MIKTICLKDQNNELNHKQRKIQGIKTNILQNKSHIFFLQNWNFSILEIFAFLSITSKVIEIHKCAITKK